MDVLRCRLEEEHLDLNRLIPTLSQALYKSSDLFLR